jgi:maltooligosyltrehalose trehalohydrolase
MNSSGTNGEEAPFQFFSDHIDQDIADATREGRRQEFAAFASFTEEEFPDPQDPATFERSKLRRTRDASLAALYERLIAARRRLPPGDPDAIEFDEAERWLRVRVCGGGFEVICNFSSDRRRVGCAGTAVELATDGEPAVTDGAVELEPMSGALVA